MKYLGFLLAIVVVASSCNIIDGNRIKGNGKITTQTYNLKNFNSIDVGGAKNLYIKQDSVFSVKIQTDENLLKLVNVDVKDNELNVYARDGYWLDPSDKINIYVSMPVLKGLVVSGASEIKTEGKFIQNEKMIVEVSGASDGTLAVRAPDFSIEASGASTLNIVGETKTFVANVNGASTLNAYDLKAESTTVDASGASTANVFASINLNAEASGASNVNYKGNPSVKVDASGASDIKKAP